MEGNTINCPYCNAKPFKSTRGLVQHQKNSVKCMQQIREKFGAQQKTQLPHDFIQCVPAIPTRGRTTDPLISDPSLVNIAEFADIMCDGYESADNSNQNSSMSVESELEAEDLPLFENESQSSSDMFALEDDSTEEIMPDTDILLNFRKYVSWARGNLQPLTKSHVLAITLLDRLRRTKASLDTYELIMDWHLRQTGALKPTQTLSDYSGYISREKLYKKLQIRYNFADNQYRNIHEMVLPHSRSQVKIVWNNAKSVIQSLLSDPRITDDDYLFYDQDPMKPPPSRLRYVEDLNTGRAYTKTYKDLITNPNKQILLPVIFYIDGANTGQFVDLPITAVRLSLGIFTRKARDKEHCWRTLGYIPSYSKQESRGYRLMVESQHMDSVIACPSAPQNAGQNPDKNVPKAQDLHAMLEYIMRSYVELQDTGFKWDLRYKNKTYRDIEFVLFTPFLKLDSDEAEKLCGKFTSRTANVKCLCRYCECPTEHSDDPLADFPMKTEAKISRLVSDNNVEALKQISQHCIDNAMYNLRFGRHNYQGIHGACPMDMLHALLLGIFRYVRDCFFEQAGNNSQLSNEIDAYACRYGQLLSRQSERDLPKTRFANGIRRGKLNAKDFPGILLCIATTLRCCAVQRALPRRKLAFRKRGALRDWQTLVESLLQWEQWLKSDKLKIKHVKAARQKHRYLMYLIKKIGRRVEGMGLKITKFHSIIHLADDILNFGVPMEVDTGSNESAHKSEKTAAKLTQKNKETFDEQTCKRLEEVQLLEMAMQELSGNCIWDYYQIEDNYAQLSANQSVNCVGGQCFYVRHDETTNKNYAIMVTRKFGNQQMSLEQDFVDYVWKLQTCVRETCAQLHVYSKYNRESLIFRASTKFHGKAWRDWVIVNWGDEGKLPCHIMGFIDLSCANATNFVATAGINLLSAGIFAIVECASFIEAEDEEDLSELFVPIQKDVAGFTGEFISHRQYYLADVEAFDAPVAVVPNFGGMPNDYLLLKSRKQWKDDFISWLEAPANDDVMDSSDEEDDEQNEQMNHDDFHNDDGQDTEDSE